MDDLSILGLPAALETAKHETDYLARLGERIRNIRAQRGMTRKILARDSKVSERYLAQLEMGQGNISINLLRQVAHALATPLADLLQDEELSVEMKLLHEFLVRLDPQQLQRVWELLFVEFGNLHAQGRRERIALIGLRGGGKSTLGTLLAKRMGIPFIKLSQEIEREAGTSLSEMFSLYGQSGYRRYERRALEAVVTKNKRAVIEIPGGLVAEPGTFELLLSSCIVVWLRTSPEEHMMRVIAQGDHRPMDDNNEAMEDLRRILQGRAPLYAKADIILHTSGKTVQQSLEELNASLESHSSSNAMPRE
ncbi:MAG TPA: helix-turn-helix transcriptional regulator [Burkholderiaceae bacterium]|nr:helix-turn-helix transcriptional regulator [Burkholderiaceae bacterium]